MVCNVLLVGARFRLEMDDDLSDRRIEPALCPAAAALLERLFLLMEMGSGPWTLEVRAEDGRVRSFQRREGPLGRTALARFDSEG